MSTGHSLFSPSALSRRLACAASAAMEAPLPDTSSGYADEGTAAHLLFASCLDRGQTAASQIGDTIYVDARPWIVTEEMAEAVDAALAWIAGRLAQVEGTARALGRATVAAHCLTELRVPTGSVTGDDDDKGTADVVLLHLSERDGASYATLDVIDYKHGAGVAVYAADNPQLMAYACGVLDLLAPILDDCDHVAVSLAILQPRAASGCTQVDTSVLELRDWASGVQTMLAPARALVGLLPADIPADAFAPGEACRFCSAKAVGPDGQAICPGLKRAMQDAVADFAAIAHDADLQPGEDAAVRPPLAKDGPDLATAMRLLPVVEGWCTAVRAETERRLLAAINVPGYKLVQGRAGARRWSSPEAVEVALKRTLKVDELYDRELISPTAAEKLHKKGRIGVRVWAAVTALITRAEGRLSVAPVSDPRDAVDMTAPASLFPAADQEV